MKMSPFDFDLDPSLITRAKEDNVTSLVNVPGVEGLTLVYGIIIPTISALGVIGNMLSLVILNSNKNFRGFMFIYIKALAISDICYLLSFLQFCYFVCNFYYLSENYRHAKSKMLMIYIWSVLGPMMKIFVGCSDLIILLMAVDRFRVMKNIDQLRISERNRKRLTPPQTRPALIRCLASFVICILLYLPYGWQFDIVPGVCDANETTSEWDFGQKSSSCDYKSVELNETCWLRAVSAFAQDPLWWNLHVAVSLIILKVATTLVISYLNLAMLKKLRILWIQRRRLKASINKLDLRSTNLASSSSSTQVSSAFMSPSVSTISKLILHPELPGFEGPSSGENLARWKRLMKIHRKEEKNKKLLVFSLPSKTSMREIKLTTILVSVVVCHITLNLPQTITSLLFATFPEVWNSMDDSARIKVSNVANTLCCVNYSINFYLYFITNEDIRKEVFKWIKKLWDVLYCCSRKL